MNDESCPTIVIVDDDAALMRCVGLTLEREEGLRVIGRTTHAQAGLAMAVFLRPDVVLMDIHMPGCDPFLACREIVTETARPTRVLFYTSFPRDQYVDRCAEAGASGLASKHTETVKDLAVAVRHVAAGNTYYSPEVSRRVVALEEGRTCSRLATLTDREIEVLRAYAQGKTQTEIADLLDVSERTVNQEVADLKEKLALNRLGELLLFAINEGLVFPELQPRHFAKSAEGVQAT